MAIPASSFQARQKSLQEMMRREGLSALVAFGLPTFTNTLSSGAYVRYLTGWSSRSILSMLIQPVDGAPTLFVSARLAAFHGTESFPAIGRCVGEYAANFGKAARQLLLELGARRAGFLGVSEMPHPIFQDLTAGDEITFEPAEPMVDDLRMVKDGSEVECHREAARISDQMLSTLFERVREFRGPAWKLQAEMEYAGRSEGAEWATAWLTIGNPADRARAELSELGHQVRPGDQVLTGTYVTHEGYFAHCLRTGSVGPPSDGFRRLYDTVLSAHQAGAAQIRAGGDARRITAEVDRVAEELLPGSAQAGRDIRNRHAHFLGLAYSERPTALAFPHVWAANRDSMMTAQEVILRPGMVLELHPVISMPGVGFATVGDVYLVTEAGAERLTRFPQDLFVA